MTEYYVEIQKGFLPETQVTFWTREQFWSVDIKGNARHHPHFATDNFTTRVETLKDSPKDGPGSEFQKLRFTPGEYYPRMARPSTTKPNASPGCTPDKSDVIRDARGTSAGQLHALIGQLEQICRVIHPTPKNDEAFGHEIRNILILACTEVEAQWKGILKANGVTKEFTTTNDYIKLANPMKLDEYKVDLTYYPWLPPIAPFEGWKPGGFPTKDLRWYHAYNQVKHDREANFEQATLGHALYAITGCFVMLCAQYGWDFALRGDEALRAFFHLTGAPAWPPSEIYVPFGEPQPRQYEFV